MIVIPNTTVEDLAMLRLCIAELAGIYNEGRYAEELFILRGKLEMAEVKEDN